VGGGWSCSGRLLVLEDKRFTAYDVPTLAV
jgi:hypothetical protein